MSRIRMATHGAALLSVVLVTGIRAPLPLAGDEPSGGLSLSQRGFEEGQFSYLDLVDAQKTFVDVRTESIETALSYHRLQIEIEHLLGQPLDVPSPQQ